LNRSFWNGNGINPYNGTGDPFNKEFYLIINLAVAGTFFENKGFPPFNPETDAPTWTTAFQLDYVRVWDHLPPTQPPIPEPVTPEPTPEPTLPTPAPVLPTQQPTQAPSNPRPPSVCDALQNQGNCQNCILKPDCVYCASNQRCLSGNDFGPTDKSQCDVGLWSARQCRLSGPIVIMASTIVLLLILLGVIVAATKIISKFLEGKEKKDQLELDSLIVQ